MTNFEVKDKIKNYTKELSPELLEEYVNSYPGLQSSYEEVVEAAFLMNQVLQEYSQNGEKTDFDDWNKRQTEAHNNLIDKVIEFINDLGKFDSNEAELLSCYYNDTAEKRLYFTQLALKFLKRQVK